MVRQRPVTSLDFGELKVQILTWRIGYKKLSDFEQCQIFQIKCGTSNHSNGIIPLHFQLLKLLKQQKDVLRILKLRTILMIITSLTSMLGQKIINKEQYILTECYGKTLKNLLSISSWENHSAIQNTVLETQQSLLSTLKTPQFGLKDDLIP